jgi:hypothetical protein
MIELLPHRLPALSRWFPAGAPGPAALAEHVLATGTGRFWADRAVQPRAIAVDCAAHVLLRGDPGALVPAELAPLGSRYIEAPIRFLPSSAPPSTGSCRGSAWSTYSRRNRPPWRAPPGAWWCAASPPPMPRHLPRSARVLPGSMPAGAAGRARRLRARVGRLPPRRSPRRRVHVLSRQRLRGPRRPHRPRPSPSTARPQLCHRTLRRRHGTRPHPQLELLAPQQGQPAARLERRLPPGTRVRPPRHRRTGRPRDIGDENPRMKPRPALRQQVDRETARTVVRVSGPE